MKHIAIPFVCLLLGFVPLARADGLPQMFPSANGSFKGAQMVTPLGAGGTPSFTQYRNAAGQWVPATVVQNICGLDSKGYPQLCKYLGQTQINVPGGVAGLDSNGQVTSSLAAASIKTNVTITNPDGSTVLQPWDLAINPDNSFTPVGPEGAIFGGLYDGAGTAMHRSLYLNGQPYGNWGAGCTLCVMSTASGVWGGGGQPAVSGVDYRNGADAAAASDYAAVGFYHYDENYPARVTAVATAFSATGVTLASAMSSEQMATLRKGMYIETNVIDPNAATANGSSQLQMVSYRGYVKSWDATHIYVYAWALPGNNAGGQVPDTSHLDTTISTYTTPVIWVGVPAKHFGENEYMVADGSRVLGAKATSIANAYEREEFDFRASDWIKPNSVSFHGWTTSFMCSNCDGNALSEDSYAYLVNGPALPYAYKAQQYGDGVEYWGYSTWLGAAGAPEIVKADNTTDSVPTDVPVGTNHILASFKSDLPSNNKLEFSVLSTKEQTASGAWTDYGIRMGLAIDSNRDRRTGLTGGSTMGQIAFNPAGDIGSVCLIGYGSNMGLCQEGNGSVRVKSGFYLAFEPASASNGLIPGLIACDSYTICAAGNIGANVSLLASSLQAVLGGTGSSGFPAASLRSIWQPDGAGGWVAQSSAGGAPLSQVSAAGYTEALTTPSSSSASCMAGQFTDDANYHYVCVATNHWKRVALSSF